MCGFHVYGFFSSETGTVGFLPPSDHALFQIGKGLVFLEVANGCCYSVFRSVLSYLSFAFGCDLFVSPLFPLN